MHTNTQHQPRGARPANPVVRAAVATLALLLTLTGPALADQVKLSGLWVQDVSVQGFSEGRIVYMTSIGTEIRRPLADVQGIRLDAYPALDEAIALIDEGKDAEARAKLLPLLSTMRETWAINWVRSLLVRVHDRLKQPAEAVQMYIALVQAQAEPVLIGPPPVESLRAASPKIKDDVRRRIEPLLPTIKDERSKEAMQEMLALVGVTQEGVGDPAIPAGQQAAPANLPAEPAITLPTVLMRDAQDPVTQLLWLGKFDEALEAANKELTGDSRRLSLRLFQRGLAQLQLAEKTQDTKMFKDAGLTFMRVVIHFPSRRDLKGAALAETGYVHSKIGRKDIAADLYRQAGLLLDAEEEPAYAKRLEKLIAAR